MAPAICGSFIQSKHDVLRLWWAVTVLVTGATFAAAVIFASRNRSLYQGYVDMYASDYKGGEQGQNSRESGSRDEGQNEYAYYTSLAELNSSGMRFASAYTAAWAALLMVYGGFVVISGVTLSPVKLGMYLGALVMFSNWSLLLAVMFGEFWVFDSSDREEEDLAISQYALERSSSAFSILALVLSVVYICYTTMLFLNQDALLNNPISKGGGVIGSAFGVGLDHTSNAYNPPPGGKTTTEGFITRSSSDL